MDRFIVESGAPLEGTLSAKGAKNSALKLMAAALVAEGRHEFVNVPRIVDVEIMSDLLRALGVGVHRDSQGVLIIDTPATADLNPEAPYALVEKMRASIVVLGPLLARCGEARISLPGGDDFGSRPIDFHIDGLSLLGATFESAHGTVVGTVPSGRLIGARVVLEYPSHTATDNLLMASVLAKGTTVIENAAREPEVIDLADYLNAMGARIKGAGTSRIEIEGVDELTPTRHRVIADRVVAATYMAAVAVAGGEIVIDDARIDHMDMLVQKLRAVGVNIELASDGVVVRSGGRLKAADVATLPYPGVATDYKPFLVTVLSVADGVSIVTENLFFGRFRYVDELRRMGADIRTEGHHAVVRGVSRLSGAPVRATDIRAGATLIIAGLAADGVTEISGAAHVARGYEDLAGALRSVGANVSLV